MHILLIDDSEPDLMYGRIMIEHAGVASKVTSFEDAREALKWLQQGDGDGVDMILLDINMPNMDGFEFLTAFEALALASTAPVVMLTSSPDPRDRERARGFVSVHDYVVKPIDCIQVRQLVQRVLSAALTPADESR